MSMKDECAGTWIYWQGIVPVHGNGSAIAITENSQKTVGNLRIPCEVNSEFSFVALYIKSITQNFSVTRGIMLGSENSELRVIVFCPLPKNVNSEFYFYIWVMLEGENSEFQLPVSFFALY